MARTTVPINDLSRIGIEEKELLSTVAADVISSGSYVLGSRVADFEKVFGRYLGLPNVISVASGTDALILALASLNLSPQSKVATVANAGGYSTTAIHAVSLHAHFIDIDPKTHLMAPQALKSAIEADPSIAVVIVTHLYGNPAEIATIVSICKEAGVMLIEDCAQATGLQINGRHVGTFGDIGTFSFFPTKNLGALGDGGAVVTSNPELAQRIHSLRQYGWSDKYTVELLGGMNSRLDEIQAAFLTLRLPNLDHENQLRREICVTYANALGDKDSRLVWNGDGVGHLAVIDSNDKAKLQTHLESQGIGHTVHYPIPDHQQPAWSGLYSGAQLPVTNQKMNSICTVPCFPNMTEVEINRVADALASFAH